jgi:hypothetical protein
MNYDYEPPYCSVKGKGYVADYHDVKANGRIYKHLCEEVYLEFKRNYKLEKDPARPKCIVPDCDKLAMQSSVNRTGQILYKKRCPCHSEARWYENRKQSDNTLESHFITALDRPNYGDLNPFEEAL